MQDKLTEEQKKAQEAFQKELSKSEKVELPNGAIFFLSQVIKTVNMKYADHKGFVSILNQAEAIESQKSSFTLTKQEMIALLNMLSDLNLKKTDYDLLDPVFKTLRPIAEAAVNQKPQSNLVGVRN